MPSKIKWKRNEFLTFYAQIKIRVGGVNNNQTVDIQEGDSFEFDGTVCKYAGDEFPQPGLKGAIENMGWATLDEAGEVPATRSVSRKIAKSKSINEDLSKVQRTDPTEMDQDSLDEETVIDVSDRKQVMDPVSGKGHLKKKNNKRTAGQRVLNANPNDVENQEGVVVHRLKSPTKLVTDVLAEPGKEQEIKNQSYESGYGRVERKTVHREGVDIEMNVGNMDRGGEVYVDDEDEGVHVGTVRKSSSGTQIKEGVTLMDTSKEKNVESNGKKPVKKEKTAKKASKPNPKLDAAQSVYPDFPADWNFFGKTEEKLDRLNKIGPNPDLVKALHASESKAMKKALEEKFSKFL